MKRSLTTMRMTTRGSHDWLDAFTEEDDELVVELTPWPCPRSGN
jgi:hypothetical protein